MDFSKLLTLTEQLLEKGRAIDKQRGEQRYPLFDQQLFGCRSKKMVPCVNETQSMIKSLIQEHDSGLLNPQRAQYLGEKITQQVQALQREINTQAIRRTEPRAKTVWQRPINELYQDLAQHQDWERRLKTMIRDKQAELDNFNPLVAFDGRARKKQQQELLALEGRHRRCYEALIKLEKQIQYREQRGVN
ncbi:primosomal replication protein [Vibrio sp. SS-MA-C1-2]|uniref:primosomal replication protein n=1 Tax=Vibrio sp. SS-MA-C1-2 TaxID=2908646 RepID=UPI001F43F450|nr:primosomal replication protein [Vibrio sp. SS-MA-C1-2]UJF18678.1 primosomal replication protein [Vibrio sp. SS-MA-C1-2]